jgi:hypothetical protein
MAAVVAVLQPVAKTIATTSTCYSSWCSQQQLLCTKQQDPAALVVLAAYFVICPEQ